MDKVDLSEKENKPTTIYEIPLNNRMRHFLRYEYLVNEIEARLASQQDYVVVDVLRLLHNLIEINTNNDMRSEIMQHLNWQYQQLRELEHQPQVDQTYLKKKLEEKKQVLAEIEKLTIPITMYHNHYLLSTTKSRFNITGGLASFHLPMFATWTTLPRDHQQADLNKWYAPFKALYKGIQNVLSMTRDSQEFRAYQSETGYYIEDFSPPKNYQMIRISVDRDIFPRLSASPSRLIVYFFSATDFEESPQQVKTFIRFEMAFSNL